MTNYSDHKKPFNDITKYLPEVYSSDVNRSLFDMAFNRHLTKDDTKRVAGFIGSGNPAAQVDRQIKETTPHRQAFQLAPTMLSTVGTVDTTLSFKAFCQQLALMGVDINRIQQWANTTQFNWAPPVNLDMLVNYQDYFWKSTGANDPAQYFTIENRCNKALSKVEAYSNVLTLRGSAFPILRIHHGVDQFVVANKVDDLFAAGFKFFTSGSDNINLLSKQWTVSSSSYDEPLNETTIEVVELIANAGPTPPVSPLVGEWWYDTSTSTLKEWNGATYITAAAVASVSIDLTRQLENYKIEANCVCNQDFGWDVSAFDFGDGAQWDTSAACVAQPMNPWSSNNRWIHKTQVQSFSDVRRAQAPILEYGSTVELNEWTRCVYDWKYRADADQSFTSTTNPPRRIELEPVKGFVVSYINDKWTIFLFSQTEDINRDIDYTQTFSAGYKFRVTDDSNIAAVYTVASAEYREVTASDPVPVTAVTGIGCLCTVIELVEPSYVSATVSGGITHSRLEPATTSMGDIWRGYHVHWMMDETNTSFQPMSSVPLNYLLQTELASPPQSVSVSSLPVHADDGLTFQPQTSAITIGTSFQEQTIDLVGVTQVDLVDNLRFSPTTSTLYATPYSNEVRVYVNNVRQRANYTELTATESVGYTLVGQVPQSTQMVTYVTSIVFETALPLFAVVRIEVGPVSQLDAGMFCVPVRTIEDEVEFTLATVAGTQPAYKSITSYHREEQAKRLPNQYPLFTVFDVTTSEVVTANNTFGFNESETAPINAATGKRVVMSSDAREFEFKQHLVKENNGELYAYRDTHNVPTYWYSTADLRVRIWNGSAWTVTVPAVLSTGGVAFKPVQSSKFELDNPREGDVWHNSTTSVVSQWNGLTWDILGEAYVGLTDPSLRTIWKTSAGGHEYTPQYVDGNRVPVTANSPAGDWEVVDQWMFNSQHHNHEVVKYSQIVTHCGSIVTSQPSLPGLLGGGAFTRVQTDMDYGLGGTIKEHNNGFDTLISAVNVTNVTPVGVIEFAGQEYAAQLLAIKDIFNASIVDIFSNVSQESLVDQSVTAADHVVSVYESNDFTAQIYGDSVGFNRTTSTGIRNWIATAPMIGLADRVRPHLSVDRGVVRLTHHDGHRSTVVYSAAETDRVARVVCNTIDTRGGTMGLIRSTTPPQTETAIITEYESVRSGVYWYNTTNPRRLYRFEAYSVGGTVPSLYTASGAELPDGVMYYNTSLQATFEKTGLSWVAITTLGDEDVSPLWKLVDVALLVGKVLLNVEQRLYDSIEPVTVYNYDSLTPTLSEVAAKRALDLDRFLSFVTSNDISTPFTNVDYVPGDAFSWNYSGSTALAPPRLDITPSAAATWQEVYTRWYGTPYPHLEPWALQGFTEKPVWWDSEYLDTTSNRRWIYNHATLTGMWENIRVGNVPSGREYPNGQVSTGNFVVDGQSLPTYAYFSVNISDATITGGYAPDTLLPPYYDNSAIVLSMPTVRSLYTQYAAEIAAPDADYAFGDVGPVEWSWLVSSRHVYDNALVAFQMQPMRFMHEAFGPTYTTLNHLQVETTLKQVYSHQDALFHGDVYGGNLVYSVRGLNQWYVNYNRFSGFDTNGEFRQLWAGWTPKLTYQFAGIVDTGTFEIANKYFDIISQDYNIVLANNGVIRDLWVDAFEARLITIPPALVQYNNQSMWKIELDTLASSSRTVSYYGVKSYPFQVNVSANTCTAFNYDIITSNSEAHRFGIGGDHTSVFVADTQFVVTDSGPNDGTYTVLSSIFETNTNRTRINVAEHVPVSSSGGHIDVPRVLPWETGDVVVIGSTKFTPAPVLSDTPYYVIKLGPKTFKLAESKTDATLGNAITLTSVGNGTLTISEVVSTFKVFGGAGNTAESWYHFALDKTDIRTFSLPYTILGMQSFVNLMDGYSAYQHDSGILQGLADSSDFDPDTGRLVTWELETERFMDWAYGLRQSRITVSDRYTVTVAPPTDLFTFGAAIPRWSSGTAVIVSSSSELPEPLIPDVPYYIVATDTEGVVKLSSSANVNDLGAIVNVTTEGSGQVMLGLYARARAYPRFELNPTRNNIWIDTPTGVLSNVIAGPYNDIRVQQTIFDQYSRPVESDKLTTYRQDLRSHIAIRPALKNDIDRIYTEDPYNYVHIGGAHLFVEGYEHFLVFEDYTVGDSLIYDAFLGLSSSRFNVDYFEKEEYTLRPTLGGYYLYDHRFLRNIEGSASDMRNYYDILELSETTDVARRSRALLGYKGRSQFLDFLNVNSKSQFLFYRGMIQTKGSVNSVKAYINSRRFVDAQLDEFWAWKIAEYGDSRVKTYPEVKLFSTDGALDDVRLEFLADSEVVSDEDVTAAVDNGFQVVSFKDDARWNMFPEQRSEIKSPLFLNADVSSMTLIHAGLIPPAPGAEQNIQYWFNTENQQLYSYNSTTMRWTVNVTKNKVTIQPVVLPGASSAISAIYYKLDVPCDTVRVLRRSLTPIVHSISSVAGSTLSIAGDHTNDFVVGVPFAITGSLANDAVYYPTAVTFNGTNTVITVTGSLSGSAPLGSATCQNLNMYTMETMNPGVGIREVSRVDSEVIRFDVRGFQDVLMIFTINPSYTKLSPAKLIDTKSNTVVQQIPMWDPARGLHSHVAIHNVDIQSNSDPAPYEFAVNPNQSSSNFWNQREVGTTWLDEAELGYMPYHDDMIYPEINNRLYNWGKLAPWASLRVYQWTQSTVPPELWDDTVVKQATNASIPQNDKPTGSPRKLTFKRVRSKYTVTSVNTTTNTVTTAHTFAAGDEVLFTATTLPGGILSGVKYIVENAGTTISLLNPDTESIVDITSAGVGVFITPAFTASDWNTQSLIRDRTIAPYAAAAVRTMAGVTSNITWPYNVTTATGMSRIVWTPMSSGSWVLSGTGADRVDVYINSVLTYTGLAITASGPDFYVTVPAPLVLNEYDIIDIVRPVYALTPTDTAFNPDLDDDGTQLIQWKQDYQYSTGTVTTGGSNTGATTQVYYYFWIENATNHVIGDSTSLSILEMANQLTTIPTPYFVVQRPKDDPYLIERYGYGMVNYGSTFGLGVITDADYQVPVLYREAIIRKVASYINDDDRYLVRFAHDWSLRDTLNPSNLKNKHQEWVLFRREQTNTIPRELWDRLVEALIGHKLSDDTIRVPALERELYDSINGTDTRFGLGVDQAFVDKQLGLNTILSYLQDPSHDFSPVDINIFFASNSFDSSSNIIAAMETIYTTFNASHVNAMWFEALSDALSTRSKYKELMKTSWIALHGIRVLEVGGMFDD